MPRLAKEQPWGNQPIANRGSPLFRVATGLHDLKFNCFDMMYIAVFVLFWLILYSYSCDFQIRKGGWIHYWNSMKLPNIMQTFVD